MFFISISNGLLTAEHREKIGPAIWEYMWLIDKITKVDDDGKGHVLGGKPIKLDDIGMGQHHNTVSRNMSRLEEQKYIETTRTPYGMTIRVLKAKKRFTKSSDSLNLGGDSPKMGGDSPKMVITKKTIQRHNKDNIYKENDWLNETAWEAWETYRNEIKKPLTLSTVKLQIKFLSTHQKDHALIIKQSIINGWRGLFPLKKNYQTDIADKAKAFDKLKKDRDEETERKANAQHNDKLREINIGLAQIGKIPWNK